MKGDSIKSAGLRDSVRSGDDYVAAQKPEFRETLEKLRKMISRLAPDAVEIKSYGVLCYRSQHMLVGIGVTKQYCSLYVMSPSLVEKLKGDLGGHSVSGSTIHFDPGKLLPAALIRKIVKLRIMENEGRRKNKKTSQTK